MEDLLLLPVKMTCAVILWILMCRYLCIIFGPMTVSKAKSVCLCFLLGCLWCLAAALVTAAYYQAILHLLIALWLSRYYPGKSAAKSLAVCIFVMAKMFLLLLAIGGLRVMTASHLQYPWWFSRSGGYLIQGLVMVILVCLLNRYLTPLPKVFNLLPSKWLYAFCVIFLAIGMILYITNNFALNMDHIQYGFTLEFCLSIISVVLMGSFIIILLQLTKAHIDQLQSAQIQQHIVAQKQHLQASEVQDKEEQEMAHDFQNRLCALSGYLHNGQYTEALTAIEAMQKHPLCNVTPLTGLAPIDSVFAEKRQLAEAKEIKLTYAIVLLETIDILDVMDLAIIIANGLDNAIEASQAIDEPQQRMVICTLSTYGQSLTIRIQNRTAEDISIPPSMQLATSKADTANHGLGLASIRRLAAKHDGSYALSCEHRIFTLEINFPLDIDQK